MSCPTDHPTNKPRPSPNKPHPPHEGGGAKQRKGRGQRGRDLSFYLNHVLSSLPPRDVTEDGPDDVTSGRWSHPAVVSLVTSLSEALVSRSAQYARTFQPLGADERRPLVPELKHGEKHYDVRLLLKRPVFPNMFEVQTGQLYGLPPGCALYRIRKCTSPEEQLAMRRLWRGCLDKEGYVSPLKVYPWLAKAILDAVVYLRERDEGWKHLDFRLQATFPVIRMELTFKRDSSYTPRHRRPSTAATRSRVASAKSEYNSSTSPSGYRITSAKSEYKTSVNDDVFEGIDDNCCDADDVDSRCLRSATPGASMMSGGSTVGESQCNQSTSTSNNQNPHRSHSASASTSKSSSRLTRQNSAKSSQIGALSPLIAHTSTAWAFLEENKVPDPPETIHLNFIPTIEGFGWPKGVRFPQVLPKQRPWSVLSKQWTSDLRDSIRDGEPFWELTPFNPIDILHADQNNYVPFWRINFQPTQDYLLSRLSELAISSTIEGLFDALDLMTEDFSKIWSFLGNHIKNEVKVITIKNNLHRNGTVSEWFLAILEVTTKVIENKRRQQGGMSTDDLEDKLMLTRLLQLLKDIHQVSVEDPRKLVEMIKLPDVTDGLDLGGAYSTKTKKTSTPASTHRSTMTMTTKSVASEEPAKPPRMLYRLFSKNF